MRRNWPGVLVFVAAACGTSGSSSDPANGAAPTEPTPTTSASPPAAATSSPSASDAGANDAGAPLTAKECFKNLIGKVAGPDYDSFGPVIAPSCAGTHHQNITGVERLVFLGDSVTEGTPPNLPTQYYRTLVGDEVAKRWPGVQIDDCAAWGAETNDLLLGKNEIAQCFPNATEPKKTLVVMTVGGNDINSWAKDQLSAADATVKADAAAKLLRDAVDYLKAPGRFPKGVDIVFANVYEYTDTSGDLLSCPAALVGGIKGNWPEGTTAVVHFQEQYMKIAVDEKIDMIFLLEHFCGHGYKRDDPTLQCYRGPNTDLWFDLTCIHPNPTGHQQIADLFMNVIDGK